MEKGCQVTRKLSCPMPGFYSGQQDSSFSLYNHLDQRSKCPCHLHNHWLTRKCSHPTKHQQLTCVLCKRNTRGAHWTITPHHDSKGDWVNNPPSHRDTAPLPPGTMRWNARRHRRQQQALENDLPCVPPEQPSSPQCTADMQDFTPGILGTVCWTDGQTGIRLDGTRGYKQEHSEECLNLDSRGEKKVAVRLNPQNMVEGPRNLPGQWHAIFLQHVVRSLK